MLKKIVVAIFFLSIALLYFHNLTRDIYGGDIGDLVTASYLFGVAHPPGYPLFTFLGFILSRLPFPAPPVTKVALISAISSFIGLVIYYKFSLKVTKSLLLSLLTTSILAFSYFFWLNAEMPEAFGLNNFFAIVLLYFAIQFYERKKKRYLYLLGFFAGLSLTHHQTIITIFPGLLILSLRHFKFVLTKRRFIPAVLLFILGFSAYIYVPIAARQNPAVNWDNASNLNNFLHLVLRKDYDYAPSIAHGVPTQVHRTVLSDYLKTILATYSYQVAFLLLLGAFYLFKIDKRLFLSLFSAFLLSGPVFVVYGASPVTTKTAMSIMERFYSLSSVVGMFFIPYGIVFLRNILNSLLRNKLLATILLLYFFIVPTFMLKYNFPKTDLSNTQIGNELAYDVLSSLPENAVLFLHGDTKLFNVWYVRYVLGIRTDVDIINPPNIGANVYLDEEINNYYKKQAKTKKNDLLKKTLEDIRARRPIFSTYGIEYDPRDSLLLPHGLVYELIYKKNTPSLEAYRELAEKNLKKLHIKSREVLKPSEMNNVTPEIPTIYSNGFIFIGDFIDSYYKNPALAEHYYRRGLWIDRENSSGYSGLGLSLYKAYNDCKGAERNLKKAIELYSIWKTYYKQLYLIYDRCGFNKKKDSFKKEYYTRFKENIDETVKK
ncbi:DUF2723 domain-containing protein [Candidatus Roizmanbacteria bacterium]|nr:DUF2723 domain-containing protein [Candidatus Roizmanbacteria bacterium]